MIRTSVILLLGLLVAVGGYCARYFSKTAAARAIEASDSPELSWLKEEFDLSDAEFARIRGLHGAYLPGCATMCAKIATVNKDLEALVLQTNQVTPEIAAKLAEIGKLRQECQTMMLSHFYAVSQSMPPEQGRRYLAEMQKLTSLSNMRDHAVSAHSEHAH
jgi:hypothetical protein